MVPPLLPPPLESWSHVLLFLFHLVENLLFSHNPVVLPVREPKKHTTFWEDI